MSQSAPPRDEFFDSVLSDFLDESGQLLDRLNENLLKLDEWTRDLAGAHERCDAELLNDMFRSAHSLKGLSAMLGLTEINSLTHRVENVFDAARKDELAMGGDVVELMFQAVDRLVSLVDALRQPAAEPVECQSVIDNIAAILQQAGVERRVTTQADADRALDELAQGSAPAQPAAEPRADTPPAPGWSTRAKDLTQPPAELSDPFAAIVDEQEISPKYLAIYIDEADLSLDELTETLLALEGGGSRAALEKLLVTAHRIKGSSAALGLNRAAKLAHLMEDLLQELVERGGALSPGLTDAMLRSTDALRQYVEGLRHGSPGTDHFADPATALVAARAAECGAAAPSLPPPEPCATSADNAVAIPPALCEAVARQIPPGMRGYAGVVAFQPHLPLAGLKAQLLCDKLAALGELCYCDPPASRFDELEELEVVAFGLVTEQPIGAIRGPLSIAGVRAIALEPVAERDAAQGMPVSAAPAPAIDRAPSPPRPTAETEAASATRKERPADSAAKPAETLRVDIERLDQLMNLAGQLVINKAHFVQIGDRLREAVGAKRQVDVLGAALSVLENMADAGPAGEQRLSPETKLENLRNQARRIHQALESIRRDVDALNRVRGAANELSEAVHQLARISDGIQQSVMDMRMVPIGPLFTRFKRVVRDITRTNGRQIHLVTQGEKTELDKRLIDELGDPLIHMVRNAADHGIEPPEVRTAAGKPAEGTITLDAFHRGNNIIIQVRDDGKGLDSQRILRKALEKGLLSPADAEKLTPHQIFQLIWEPGLSTAERVTEVSGRGMGMDIVKSKIEDLNGSVELQSAPGEGTTITIRLPLTLAIMPSLMVEIDGEVFAMPVESIVEIVSPRPGEFSTVHGLLTASIRGRTVSAVRLNDVFQWTTAAARPGAARGDETTLVVVRETGRELALAVDRVLREEDVVIKSMAENYRNVPGVAGASILGDGRVSLILDLAAVLDMAAQRARSAAVRRSLDLQQGA